jgi:hypothetical protein
MRVSLADVRATVERVCARPDVLDACARRGLGTVIVALGSTGLTQGRISALTGIPQGRLSEYATGKRRPQATSTFEAFADGLALPLAARRAMGLAAGAHSLPDASASDVGIGYPRSAVQATEQVTALWRADLTDVTAIQRGKVDPRAWNEASLRCRAPACSVNVRICP